MPYAENEAYFRATMLSNGPLEHTLDDGRRQDFDTVALVQVIAQFTAEG